MEVYVMRHGQAAMFAASDSKRPLTQDGREEVRQMGHWLLPKITQLDYVFVSPYLRAQQTWDILKQQLPSAEQIVTLKELTPSGDERAMLDLIDEIYLESPQANVLVVSHLPLVGYLFEALAQLNIAPLFSTASIGQVQFVSDQRISELTHPFMLKNKKKN